MPDLISVPENISEQSRGGSLWASHLRVEVSIVLVPSNPPVPALFPLPCVSWCTDPAPLTCYTPGSPDSRWGVCTLLEELPSPNQRSWPQRLQAPDLPLGPPEPSAHPVPASTLARGLGWDVGVACGLLGSHETSH